MIADCAATAALRVESVPLTAASSFLTRRMRSASLEETARIRCRASKVSGLDASSSNAVIFLPRGEPSHASGRLDLVRGQPGR